jgi:hypothetical protein
VNSSTKVDFTLCSKTDVPIMSILEVQARGGLGAGQSNGDQGGRGPRIDQR